MRSLALACIASVLACGCATHSPAPVVDRTMPGVKPSAPAAARDTGSRPTPPRSPDGRPGTYVVKSGDTLYSIALEHGLDYRELGIWNGLDNPGAIRVGMQLRLSPPGASAAGPAPGGVAPGGVVAAPLKGPGGTVEARPLGTGPSATPLPAPAAAAAGGNIVSEPKAVRMPYSEQALAQLSKAETAPPPARVEAPRAADAKPAPQPAPQPDAGSEARGPEEVDWGWPVKGKIVGTFNDGSSKGIAIAGRMGQPVLASAPGRVIFSGTGIRGFGKLVVIKHNNTYLSVYAHNSELSVKEGQTVAKGQKIGEMGNTDADQVKLHFEIRRFGKPVDPMKLLPAG